jgi:hypothetical protein
MTTYYSRTQSIHTDGTPILKTADDERIETETAALLGAAWSCELRSFGKLAPLDWFAVRHGRLVSVLELKSRSHASDTYPTVFLNVRKWLALTLASTGLGVPALFVARFTDGVRWVNVAEVDASRVRMGGCRRHFASRADIEPVIEVAVAGMRMLLASNTQA